MKYTKSLGIASLVLIESSEHLSADLLDLQEFRD
jgi:hypothetical protein